MSKLASILRWAARLAGVLMALLLIVFLAGNALSSGGFSGLMRLSLAEYLEFLAVFVMLGGVITAWWRELLGGVLCIAGGVLFTAVESLSAGHVDLVWFPLVFTLIGIVFAAAWTAQRRRAAPKP